MTVPEPSFPSDQHRLQSFWGRMLLPLLVSLTSLILGWHLSEPGHGRQLSASQTSPALPELRAPGSVQPSVQGVGTLPEPLRTAPLTRWHASVPLLAVPPGRAMTDLLALGRMNLDGG